MDKGYWIKDRQGTVPALVKWWQGIGGILDVSNPEAVAWFTTRLNEMRLEYGIDSFKFDAGEMTYLPPDFTTHIPWSNPASFATEYVSAVTTLGDMIEVRCGFRSQRCPVFVRMGDTDSVWGYTNGLRTLIPTTLTLGILGYPYVLPDMIGGNGYGADQDHWLDTAMPDRELNIRWLEVREISHITIFKYISSNRVSIVIIIIISIMYHCPMTIHYLKQTINTF
jgi:alpha-glucosidase (family GH31 glycosyl hydrolase)